MTSGGAAALPGGGAGDNVTAGNVTAAIVARKIGTLDDNIFNAEEKKGENA